MKNQINLIVASALSAFQNGRSGRAFKLAAVFTVLASGFMAAPRALCASYGQNVFALGGVGTLYQMREASGLSLRELTDMSTLFGPSSSSSGAITRPPVNSAPAPVQTIYKLKSWGAVQVSKANLLVNGRAVSNKDVVSFAQQIHQGCLIGFGASNGKAAFIPNGLGTVAPTVLFPVVGGYTVSGNQIQFSGKRIASFGTQGAAQTTLAGVISGSTAYIAATITIILNGQRVEMFYQISVPVQLIP